MSYLIENEDFKRFAKLFQFTHDPSEKSASFFSISGEFLFRRDSTRLIAYRLPFSAKQDWNYLFHPNDIFSSCCEIELEDSGVLHVRNQEKHSVSFQPQSVPLESHSLSVIREPSFDTFADIETLFLTRQLTSMYKKIHAQGLNPKESEVVMNLKNKTWYLYGREHESVSIPCQIKKETDFIISYPFPTCKDFLINANMFHSVIRFYIKNPYYSVLQYSKNIFGVLLHKQDSPSS